MRSRNHIVGALPDAKVYPLATIDELEKLDSTQFLAFAGDRFTITVLAGSKLS